MPILQPNQPTVQVTVPLPQQVTQPQLPAQPQPATPPPPQPIATAPAQQKQLSLVFPWHSDNH